MIPSQPDARADRDARPEQDTRPEHGAAGGDAAAVRAVVQAYVDAVTAGDSAAVRAVFRPDAHMWGYLGERFVSAPIDAFCEVVAADTGERPWTGRYSSTIRSVEVTGEVAVAVLEEHGYQDADFTNHFSLVRADGHWLIAAKTFHSPTTTA
ncbi:SgcJ/EcaC family oxidoreductase [Kitasatospora sp. NPDC056327]|uniref:SgcJ/EcaC family oxidoreductase n=1 Tax=Kitasatospora sp. NPDC056327 TaxID=3345785 RepID=UPI0035E1CB2C